MNDSATQPALSVVIVWHRVGPALTRSTADHFDWFFETDRDESVLLLTFATDTLPTPPARATGESGGVAEKSAEPPGLWTGPANWLARHRRRYLTYEGTLAGDRGELAIAATGSHRIVASDEQHFVSDCTLHPKPLAVQQLTTRASITCRCRFYRNVAGQSPGRLCVEWEGALREGRPSERDV